MASIAGSGDSGTTEPPVSFTVVHNRVEHLISLPSAATVGDLREELMHRTSVSRANQRLAGLPPRTSDDTELRGLKKIRKLMLVGTAESALVQAKAEEAQNIAANCQVVDDLDLDVETVQPVHSNPEFIAKIERRLRDYTPLVISSPRPSKKLLVLDVDYTLFDHRSVAEHARELARPFLHEFLTIAYRHYDIAIWSATSMRWVELKMRELGVTSSDSFQILALFCHGAMITIKAEKYGMLDVKPLGVVWGKYPQYSAANTVMFDDLSRNFLMNPQSGLKIRPCRAMTVRQNRERDTELLRLSRYLELLAPMSDLREVDHRRWESRLAEAERDAD